MDAMSGRGKLEDWGLVADFYGLGERAEYRSEQTETDGADSIVLGGIQDSANWADWGGKADWRTGGLADVAEYGILDGADWSGLGPTGRTQRTTESWTGRTGVDGADWGGQGGLERTGRTGRTGLGRMGRSGERGGLGWTERIRANEAEGGVLGRA